MNTSRFSVEGFNVPSIRIKDKMGRRSTRLPPFANTAYLASHSTYPPFRPKDFDGIL